MPCSAVEPDRMRAGSEKLPEAGSETLCLFRYIDGNECVQAKKNRLQRRFLKGMALTSPGQNHSQAGESRFFRYDTPQVLQRIQMR